MKKIAAFALLFVSINITAQDDAVVDTTRQPAITAIGKPKGKIAEKIMNKDGGTLVSGDGSLELIIPPGALSKKTTISIQPIINTMPNGNGMSYRLEPSGIQFQKPVQLVFHYDPEESEDSMQLLMRIAMQDDKGQWYGLNEFTLDTVAKTISGNINHFSVWATFDQLKLRFILQKKRIKVKNSGALIITGVDSRTPEEKERMKEEMEKNGEDYEGQERYYQETYGKDVLSPLTSWKPPQKGIWRVNKIIKGNAEFGTLSWGKDDAINIRPHNIYNAPASVPDWNPVTISVDLVGASFKINDKTVKNLSLKTNILIFDNAYEVEMIHSFIGYPGKQVGKATYLDTGSFVVSLNGKDTKIIEKKNKNTVADLGYGGGACTVKTVKPGSGSIHIAGVQSIKVTPATSTMPAIVEILFKRIPVIYPLLHFDCPPVGKGSRYSGTSEKANAITAQWSRTFPMSVKFEAKEGKHMIEKIGEPSSEIYYEVWVRQLEDDYD